MTIRQKMFSLIPTIIIIVAGVTATLHLIDPALALIVEAAMVGYVCGKARETFAESARVRRAAIEHTEGFIAWLHAELAEDRVPLTQRESAEDALSGAVMSLEAIERSAPPWTRWLERRARERAQR